MRYGDDLQVQCSDRGYTRRIAATHKFLIQEKTMTDLTLRRDAVATDSGLNSLLAVLKEIFSATPLGILLTSFAGKR
jgi:hypothetical protein